MPIRRIKSTAGASCSTRVHMISMREFGIIALPLYVQQLLNDANASSRLQAHLTLVYTVAGNILHAVNEQWPTLSIDEHAVLFGAATHDIGKSRQTAELYAEGSNHEAIGEQLLREYNVEPHLARFARTHGDWTPADRTLEDLLVTLADKAWKGQRITELEERIAESIAVALCCDKWEAFMELDNILADIVLDADKRLHWQNEPHEE